MLDEFYTAKHNETCLLKKGNYIIMSIAGERSRTLQVCKTGTKLLKDNFNKAS